MEPQLKDSTDRRRTPGDVLLMTPTDDKRIDDILAQVRATDKKVDALTRTQQRQLGHCATEHKRVDGILAEDRSRIISLEEDQNETTVERAAEKGKSVGVNMTLTRLGGLLLGVATLAGTIVGLVVKFL